MSKNKFALCSGGKDSIVATHKTMQEAAGDKKNAVVVYLDTTIGIEANRQYVEDLCDEYNWQLWTLRTQQTFEQMVEEYGFPGPSMHKMAYSYLKERQLSKLASVAEDPHFYTGIRINESDRRMRNYDEEDEMLGATWHKPIAHWTLDDVEAYIEDHNIPENELWNQGHFKDCGCGAYGSPSELIELEADYPEVYERIRKLEESVDRDDEYTTWGWGALSDEQLRGIRAENDDQQLTLCSMCGVKE